ncbi:UDP-N-acetylmuramoyl-tripeptide--D-alanyl-D-alanine ligase [Kamptonema cortianum]|nr:UDP-N-acetylmuramoyl-tripeptide--D-alanyl-D-alanine ligase [Geitlerinema splendidum]MDK3158819.1 UDP-N-acetylmuramoyl-tripeptide--D-alanyl-D-alanine ligase [Kamptonema cortianum]
MTLGELAKRCGGKLFLASEDVVLNGFTTDSREVQDGKVFLAIRGANVDGHSFASDVISQGATAVLSERECGVPSIVVDDLVDALARFGKSLREEFNYPVIGITGSNGKTTCKEYAAAALSVLGPVLKSPGNRNTEFTSPLVWFDMTGDQRSAVIEMAMRGSGQIQHLAEISQPTIGIVTCIGTAHIEMVGSRAGIARAKGELLESLPPDGLAIIWNEDDFQRDLRSMAPCDVESFGYGPESDCRVLGYRAESWNASQVLLQYRGEQFEISLPAIGRFQALNAAAAIIAASRAGANLGDAARAISSATLPPMRMEFREFGEAVILVDTYNASPDSATAALTALVEGPSSGRRIAILGEMRELGDFSESGHRLVGRALAEANPDFVLLTGGDTRYMYEEAVRTGYPAHKVELLDEFNLEAVRKLIQSLRAGDVLLMKGSRALAMESALEGLN